jgi:hypothetical protein
MGVSLQVGLSAISFFAISLRYIQKKDAAAIPNTFGFVIFVYFLSFLKKMLLI